MARGISFTAHTQTLRGCSGTGYRCPGASCLGYRQPGAPCVGYGCPGTPCLGYGQWDVKPDTAPLVWSTGRDKPQQSSQTQRGAWSTTTRGLLTGTTCSHSHLRGQQRGQRNQVPPVVALTPLGTHLPCCCHCQMLWVLPTHAWSLSLPRAWQLGAACATFLWVLATVKGPETRHWLLALSIASISLEVHTAPWK